LPVFPSFTLACSSDHEIHIKKEDIVIAADFYGIKVANRGE